MQIRSEFLQNPEAIAPLVRAEMERVGIPGVTLALLHKGEIHYAAAFGVKDAAGSPMTEDTMFESASLTKTLFGTLVLRLVDEGKVGLDRPIMDVLKAEPWSDDPRFALITPRHCLCHACGMPNWQAKPIKIHFDPGSQFCYSGEGYFLLQHMLEQVTGKGLEALLREYFFHPLGMNGCAVDWTPEIGAAFSHGFGEDGSVVKIRDERSDKDEAPEPNAAWSLYANAFEMAKFQQYMLQEHGGLHPETFQAQHTPQNQATPEIPWGLGWGLSVKEPSILWHWGDNGGFKSLSLLDWETKDALCVYTNSNRGAALWSSLGRLLTDTTSMDDIDAFVRANP